MDPVRVVRTPTSTVLRGREIFTPGKIRGARSPGRQVMAPRHSSGSPMTLKSGRTVALRSAALRRRGSRTPTPCPVRPGDRPGVRTTPGARTAVRRARSFRQIDAEPGDRRDVFQLLNSHRSRLPMSSRRVQGFPYDAFVKFGGPGYETGRPFLDGPDRGCDHRRHEDATGPHATTPCRPRACLQLLLLSRSLTIPTVGPLRTGRFAPVFSPRTAHLDPLPCPPHPFGRPHSS